MTDESLLPPNAGEAERARAATTARLTQIPVPVGDMWSPASVPAEFLPFLAYSFSVDYWNPDWDEATKRAVIAASYEVHAFKGTRHAVFVALKGVKLDGELIEWHQRTPEGEPGTFELIVFADRSEAALTAETQRDAVAVVNSARRHSQHPTVNMGLGTGSEIGLASGLDAAAELDMEGHAAARDRLDADLGMAGALDSGAALLGEGDATARNTAAAAITLVGACDTAQVMEFRS